MPTITALSLLRIQAHANRLANHRLHAAMAPLTQAELDAPRTSFFPTLLATLNHILAVDRYYICVLHAQPGVDSEWQDRVECRALPELAAQQRASDERLIAWLMAADGAALERPVRMPRREGRVQADLAAHMLQHLFNHQVHHRGQAHATLSGTTVPPPQLDEFLMPSEPHLRVPDMAALGWSEEAVYRPRV